MRYLHEEVNCIEASPVEFLGKNPLYFHFHLSPSRQFHDFWSKTIGPTDTLSNTQDTVILVYQMTLARSSVGQKCRAPNVFRSNVLLV
jgi:hypothetical protein